AADGVAGAEIPHRLAGFQIDGVQRTALALLARHGLAVAEREQALEAASRRYAGSDIGVAARDDRTAAARGGLAVEVPALLARPGVEREDFAAVGLDQDQFRRDGRRRVVEAPRRLPKSFTGPGVQEVEPVIRG